MSKIDPFNYGQHDEDAATGDQSEAATEASDTKWLMADPRGRRLVRGLLTRSGVWRSSFTGDALTSAFREGERNAGLALLAQVQRHAPGQLAAMVNGEGAQ